MQIRLQLPTEKKRACFPSIQMFMRLGSVRKVAHIEFSITVFGAF
jgi:hypothetical protein